VVVGEVQVSRPAVGMSDVPAYDIAIFKHDLNFNLNGKSVLEVKSAFLTGFKLKEF